MENWPLRPVSKLTPNMAKAKAPTKANWYVVYGSDTKGSTSATTRNVENALHRHDEGTAPQSRFNRLVIFSVSCKAPAHRIWGSEHTIAFDANPNRHSQKRHVDSPIKKSVLVGFHKKVA